LPPEREAFLLRTAILSRLCAPLCEAVLDAPAGSARPILDALEQGNLFLFPLDNERRWYRYHHLFAQVLQQRLQQVEGPRLAEYHLRASAWCERNGMELEALRHAAVAGDLDRVARIAELSWLAMDKSFQTAAWLGWIRRLPEEMLQARPVLNLQYAWALLNGGDLEEAERRLRAAERAPAEPVVVDAAQLRTLPAQIALARSYSAQARGDLAATAAQAELALSTLPETEVYLRAQAMVFLGFTHWAHGELVAAYQMVADWWECMRQIGNISFVVAGAIGVAEIRIAQGRLRDAAAIYEQALTLAAEHDRHAQLVTPHLYLGLALLHHECGRRDAATPLVAAAGNIGAQTPLIDWPFRWCCAQAQLKEDEGDLDAALALLDEAGRRYVRNPVPDIRPVAAQQARMFIRQGRLDDARAWAGAARVAVDDELTYLREFEHMVLARLQIAEYRRDRDERALRGALGLLARLLAAAEAGGRGASVIEILLLQALAHEARGAAPEAHAALERALALAEPERYVQLFIREGPPVLRLLAAAPVRPALRGYAGRLLAALGQPGSRATELTIEPLSRRELEVLRLIAEGLSNQQIAERLSLALSSVKGHNMRIFNKLQVERRTEAIARAGELGLLDNGEQKG
jgi:LuxR family maltose regulon positive regulatory protein